MGAHKHDKTNRSDRARREQLKRDSKRTDKGTIHGEGRVKLGKPKAKGSK